LAVAWVVPLLLVLYYKSWNSSGGSDIVCIYGSHTYNLC
jgi:hypothetical protein